MELGIFSRTYEYSDPHLSFGKMSGHGLHRCQLNLSNGGMPTLPEARDEKKQKKRPFSNYLPKS